MSRDLNPEFAGLDRPIPLTLGLDSLMPFGRHKDKTVEEVCDEDPDYLEWFEVNIDRYTFDAEVENYLARICEGRADDIDPDVTGAQLLGDDWWNAVLRGGR